MSEQDKKQNEELSAEDLDQAAGGAVDYFLNLNGIKGEAQDTAIKAPTPIKIAF
jgi:hypothetical protein